MVMSCWIRGCVNRADGNEKLCFFAIPKIREKEGDFTRNLSDERRRLWLANINRKDEPTQYSKICSDHFVTGRPASMYDRANPDWAPTLKLGEPLQAHTKSQKKQNKVESNCKSFDKKNRQVKMESYLMMLYVTLEQESALKDFFEDKEWAFCKPDLSVITDRLGPVKANLCATSETIESDVTETHLQGEHTGTPKAVTKQGRSTRSGKRKTEYEEHFAAAPKQSKMLLSKSTLQPDERAQDMIEEKYNTDDAVEDKSSSNKDVMVLMADGRLIQIKVKKEKPDTDEWEKVDASKNNAQDNDNNVADGDRQVDDNVDEDENDSFVTEMKLPKDGATLEPKPRPIVLMRNIMTKPAKNEASGIELKCSMCPKQYRLQYYLDKHYKQAHDPDNPPRKAKLKKKPQSRQCDICGCVFKRTDNLRLHMQRIHQGIRKVIPPVVSTCEICGSTFKRRDHLREHILVKHSDSKLPYPCNMCDKTFIRPRGVEIHMNRDHLNEKPYECNFCKKKFFSDYSVKKHIKICQSDETNRFKCKQCEKSFTTPRNLDMHMKAIHLGGAYRCVCGEVVKWESSVTKHKRRCKTYQDFDAVNKETEGKLCNVIEEPYCDLLCKITTETECVTSGNEDTQNHENCSVKQETEEDIEQNKEHDHTEQHNDI